VQPRFSVVWKTTLIRLNGEELQGSTDNVSRHGLGVIIEKELVIGEPVKIEVAARSFGRTEFFKMEGVAVYLHKLDFNLGVGIAIRLLEEQESYNQLIDMLELHQDADRVAS
jgi:hypothetical protein